MRPTLAAAIGQQLADQAATHPPQPDADWKAELAHLQSLRDTQPTYWASLPNKPAVERRLAWLEARTINPNGDTAA